MAKRPTLSGRDVVRIGKLIYGTDRFKRQMAIDLGRNEATIIYACQKGATDQKGMLSAIEDLVAKKTSELRRRADRLEKIRWPVEPS